MSSTTLTRFPRTKAEERNIAAGKPPFSGAIYFGRRIGWGQKLSATQRRQLAAETRAREFEHFSRIGSICQRAAEEQARIDKANADELAAYRRKLAAARAGEDVRWAA